MLFEKFLWASVWFVHEVKWKICEEGLHLERDRRGKYVCDCRAAILSVSLKGNGLHTPAPRLGELMDGEIWELFRDRSLHT